MKDADKQVDYRGMPVVDNKGYYEDTKQKEEQKYLEHQHKEDYEY